MKKIFFIIIVFFSCLSIQAQKYKCVSMLVKDNRDRVLMSYDSGTIIMDTIRHSICVPRFGILFYYDVNHINELPGYKMFVDPKYGEMIVAENLSYAKFNFYNGYEKTYEFLGLQKIKK